MAKKHFLVYFFSLPESVSISGGCRVCECGGPLLLIDFDHSLIYAVGDAAASYRITCSKIYSLETCIAAYIGPNMV